MKLKSLRKESGQTLVEFALILPILVILIFGAIEFGRIFHATHVITSAAREGARAAAVGKTNTVIQEKVENALGSYTKKEKVFIKEIGAATPDDYETDPVVDGDVYFTIDPYSLSDRTGDDVTVYVKGAVDILIPIVGDLLKGIVPDPYIAESYATMRIE